MVTSALTLAHSSKRLVTFGIDLWKLGVSLPSPASLPAPLALPTSTSFRKQLPPAIPEVCEHWPTLVTVNGFCYCVLVAVCEGGTPPVFVHD